MLQHVDKYLQTYDKSLLIPKFEVLRSYTPSVCVYQSTWRNITEDLIQGT